MGYPDRKASLVIPELFSVIKNLQEEKRDPEYPLVLLAGERRSYNANNIIRQERWRRSGADGGVKMHPDDAAAAGISDGDSFICESRTGSFTATAQLTTKVPPGVLSAPNGFGLSTNADNLAQSKGPLLNAVTALSNTDPISRVPYHKHTPARIRRAADRASCHATAVPASGD
jgi:anaerobic selenocysteine-containing dehydrogenase